MGDGSAAAGCVVGALACQRDAYLRTLETEVVACDGGGQGRGPAAKTWLIEFADSVLFPEGGGQPSDHGSVAVLSPSADAIPITRVERRGLRCVVHSPVPLRPGDRVRQTVDFGRRWDHMQQHTGQHLVSAVARELCDLQTLGWGMGAAGAMNYVDLPRRPSGPEIRRIQDRCNGLIQENLPITVTYPRDTRDTEPDKGVIRVASIGGLDQNECCGTHLSQTSHISAVLLLSCQAVNAQRQRLYFVAGDRALDHATRSAQGLAALARQLACGGSPDEIGQQAERMRRSLDEAKRRERRLVAHIAKLEAERARPALRAGGGACVYHAEGGADFMTGVKSQVRDLAADMAGPLIVATGEPDKAGQVWILGCEERVQAAAEAAQALVAELKGHGRGRTWQGKTPRLTSRELEALRKLAEEGQ
ncbi:hypothetical protein CDD83_114 [Cordyceps sp. RAO-2017]|nr:hypothetical protein CDD83_114 [Cordyceps sp. RAO-2017]